jgi:hypothetical protein
MRAPRANASRQRRRCWQQRDATGGQLQQACVAGGLCSGCMHKQRPHSPSHQDGEHPPLLHTRPVSSHPPTMRRHLERACCRRCLWGPTGGTRIEPNSTMHDPALHRAQIEMPDGTSVQAFEHGLSMSIVALRGSVPAQWIMDFRQGLGKYAGESRCPPSGSWAPGRGWASMHRRVPVPAASECTCEALAQVLRFTWGCC